MQIPIYQVDAFTTELFGGNPAAVCLLNEWLRDDLLQKIASENNLSETAFLVPTDQGYDIRWFTPGTEVALCGHATLASAYVLFEQGIVSGAQIRFRTRERGELTVEKKGSSFEMNFPADILGESSPPDGLIDAIGKPPIQVLKGRTDYLLVYPSESDVVQIRPDFAKLVQVRARGTIITSRGVHSDFVSRFFCPAVGINEDPVTGSAHTSLTPYWAAELKKSDLTAIQLSERKGFLECALREDRVLLGGSARLYLVGQIQIP